MQYDDTVSLSVCLQGLVSQAWKSLKVRIPCRYIAYIFSTACVIRISKCCLEAKAMVTSHEPQKAQIRNTPKI